eukprot:5576386-Alexandrium_andersonii.AAC.1
MSASLVGSEMCIRDRHRALQMQHLDAATPCVARAERRPKRERGARQGAVSYTHLTLPTICSV